MRPRQYRRQHKIEGEKALSATVRKHLSADAVIRSVRASFEQVGETRKGTAKILMEDALMSSYAMFSLKGPAAEAYLSCIQESPQGVWTRL